jgi:hypothetical protein
MESPLSDINNVKENFENINNNFEKDLDMAKLKEELRKKFTDYQTTMKFMLADAPIEILCLPQATEKILLDQGFLRIYDLFNIDLIEIKGIGIVRVKQLAASLDKFFSML